MLGQNLYLLLLGMAAVFGFLAVREYLSNDRRSTPASKVRLRMAILFLSAALLQIYLSR